MRHAAESRLIKSLTTNLWLSASPTGFWATGMHVAPWLRGTAAAAARLTCSRHERADDDDGAAGEQEAELKDDLAHVEATALSAPCPGSPHA